MKTLDTYLRNRELKAEFRTIVVVKNRPEGILFQGFADFPHSDPYLLPFDTKVELVQSIKKGKSNGCNNCDSKVSPEPETLILLCTFCLPKPWHQY